ncbi:unnamed protein product, partial [Prorocentrum cordatum]
ASSEWISVEKWAATIETDRKWNARFYQVCRHKRPLSTFVPGVVLVVESEAVENNFS